MYVYWMIEGKPYEGAIVPFGKFKGDSSSGNTIMGKIRTRVRVRGMEGIWGVGLYQNLSLADFLIFISFP
jgi:hypothetical protein